VVVNPVKSISQETIQTLHRVSTVSHQNSVAVKGKNFTQRAQRRQRTQRRGREGAP